MYIVVCTLAWILGKVCGILKLMVYIFWRGGRVVECAGLLNP